MSREREIRERFEIPQRVGLIEALLSIIDEQRAETERLRSQVRRWKQKYEMADTEW